MHSDGDHMTGRVDVSDSKDVDVVFDNIKTKYYMPPNIVVNIAGILKDNFLLNTPEEDFQKVIDVNLKVRVLWIVKYIGNHTCACHLHYKVWCLNIPYNFQILIKFKNYILGLLGLR